MRKTLRRKHRDPLSWITQRTPLADDQQRDIGIAYRASLQAMLRGHGSEQAWSTLACTLNVALVLCENNLMPGAMNTIKFAQQALLRARARAQRTNKWAFDGEGIRVIQIALTAHDAQISAATRGQIIHALEEVYRRVEAAETV